MPRYVVEATIITPIKFAVTAEDDDEARQIVEDRLTEQLADGDSVQVLDSWEAEEYDEENGYDEDLDKEE